MQPPAALFTTHVKQQPTLGNTQEPVPDPAPEQQAPAPQPAPVMRAVKKGKTPKGVQSAYDVLEEDHVILDLGPYRKYFGSVSNNFDMMAHGQPGAGKTTYLLQFADWLANNVGPTLYVSSEEFGSVTLKQKIAEFIGTPSPNLYFSRDMRNIDPSDFSAIFMDSVNHIGLDINSYKALREKYPDQIFVLILQKTKGGDFKGGKDWEHEVDIAAEFQFDMAEDERKLVVTKNRFGTQGENIL